MAQRVKLLPTIGAEIPYYDYTALIGNNTTNSLLLRGSDIGKALKLSADSRFEFCADGDEIVAQLRTVEPNQTSGGYRVGTVRSVAIGMLQGINDTSTALAVGDEVVASAQAAYGTPNATEPYNDVMRVKKAPDVTGLRLRVVAIQSGNGGQGSVVTLSKLFNGYVVAP